MQALLDGLQGERHAIEASILGLREEYAKDLADLATIREILSARQGEVTLGEVIHCEGKKAARYVIQDEIARVNRAEEAKLMGACDVTRRRWTGTLVALGRQISRITLLR